MKAFFKNRKRAGLTLMELVIYLLLGTVVSLVTYSFLTSQTKLYAKNMSIVHSHSKIQIAMDRLLNNMQQANCLPVLIDTNGAATAAPSAGVYYDRYLGDPYVVSNPGGTGLSASATTLTLTRSTAALASPPVPVPGDTLLLNASPTNVRAPIATVTPGATVGNLQTLVVTLTSTLGTAIPWTASQTETATLVHREAFIVVPVTTSAELRYFPNFEPMPVLTNPANYVVISNQMSITAGETTPFSIDLIGPDKIVRASLFARSTDYSTYLATKQAGEFNTFVRVNEALPSRLRPQQ